MTGWRSLDRLATCRGDVIDRGNNRQDVFHKEGDFEAFLKALGELKQRKPFELYGDCLLNNDFHLLPRPLEAPISLWAKKMHRPIEEHKLAAVRRSSATGLPYGGDSWVRSLSRKLNLDLTIRPRGRTRKAKSE